MRSFTLFLKFINIFITFTKSRQRQKPEAKLRQKKTFSKITKLERLTKKVKHLKQKPDKKCKPFFVLNNIFVSNG